MTRRAVKVGSVTIGGGAPIVVQSMTNTDTRDVAATVAQIERLQAAGCEIVRVAVPDRAAAAALSEIKERIPLPLVADIHFDHRLALAAIEAGVDKLRLNPGNITDPEKIGEVVEAAKEAGIPIRVGANSGSLAPEFRGPHGGATAEGMVESALREIRILEERGFHDIVISLKATDVPTTIAAYRMIASKVDYPLHIGITEAGTPWEGSIRSAVGLGVLLEEGLGDTIRVSLTGNPVEEVHVAYAILRALGLRKRGILYRVCPTCGRAGGAEGRHRPAHRGDARLRGERDRGGGGGGRRPGRGSRRRDDLRAREDHAAERPGGRAPHCGGRGGAQARRGGREWLS